MATNKNTFNYDDDPFILPTQSSSSESDSEDEDTGEDSSCVVLSTPNKPTATTSRSIVATTITTTPVWSLDTPSTPYTESPQPSIASVESFSGFLAPPLTMKTRAQHGKENRRQTKTRSTATNTNNPYDRQYRTNKRRRIDKRKPPPPSNQGLTNQGVVAQEVAPPPAIDVHSFAVANESAIVVAPQLQLVEVPQNISILTDSILAQLPRPPPDQQTLEVPDVQKDQERWVKEWANATLQQVIGPDIDVTRIAGMTSQSKAYQAQKERSFNKFVESMRKHELFAPLAEESQTLGPSGKLRIKLFDYIEGMPTLPKKKLINNVCINHAKHMKMDVPEEDDVIAESVPGKAAKKLSEIDPVFHPEEAAANPSVANRMYQPNTVTTKFKHIFAIFASNGCMIGQKDFINFPGSYQLYWTVAYKYTAAIRDDFGKRPNRAQVEMDGDLKIRKAIAEGKLDISNNYEHCLMYITYLLSYMAGTRGSNEVRHKRPFRFRKHE